MAEIIDVTVMSDIGLYQRQGELSKTSTSAPDILATIRHNDAKSRMMSVAVRI